MPSDAKRRRGRAPTTARDPAAARFVEPRDEGYGASHGYPAGHGGPTSPGDPPADGDDPVPARWPRDDAPARERERRGPEKRG